MTDEDTYGIFLRNLVAKDGSGTNNITLIDKTGCPVEVKMMREVRKLDKSSKSLESYLEAFTFTGSSVLELEADVETCLENCQPVLCNIPTGRSEDDLETVYSYGRKKREATEGSYGEVLSTMKLAKSLAVKAPEFGVGQPYYEANYATPVTAPTRTVFKEKKFDTPPPEGDIVCFEPTITAVFGSLTLFVELSILASCIAISRRWRREGAASKHIFSINYANSTDGSDFTIS
ncbi:uncharacterized protein LOC111089311 [Limulus polyphemus]|uniref:Uncharacterized protein LOC111089311 n=1 Tax=Limulus polyphemus TaxID=6850 RepID=A0ABM1TN30_LIMPO|nr:uncharacterized protein LOC111089311 [Limulus polyphemus]